MSLFRRLSRKKDPARKRFEFTITIHSLSSFQVKDGVSFSIHAQRGRKNAETSFRSTTNVNQSGVLLFDDEALVIESSLRYLSDARFKSKSLRLSVIEKSSKEKTVVQVKQDLSQFVKNSGAFKQTVAFPLKKWKGNSNAKLTLTIESRDLGDAGNDATATEASTSGAYDSFQETDLEGLEEVLNDPAISEMAGPYDNVPTVPSVDTKSGTPENNIEGDEMNLQKDAQRATLTAIPSTSTNPPPAQSGIVSPEMQINSVGTSENSEKPQLTRKGSLTSVTSGFSDISTATDKASERSVDIHAEDRVALLLTTNQKVVDALYQTFIDETSNIVPQAIADLSRGLGSTTILAKLALHSELKFSTENNSEPLRSNTFTTKAMERIIASGGNAYIKSVIPPLLKELLESNEVDFHIELYPTPEAEKQNAHNVTQLITWCSRFTERIFNSAQELPPIIRHVCRYLKDETSRLGLDTNRVLGNLLILRLLNPSISLPFAKGLIEKQPTEVQKANFISIARILQHITNHTLVNDAQPSAQELNAFIQEQYEACEIYLQNAVSSTREFDAEIFKTDKKIDASLQRQVVATSIELKHNLQNVLKCISDAREVFQQYYNCSEEELNVMLRTGVPFHIDQREAVRTDVSSIRRLFKKKKWTTAKSNLQSLEKRYENAEEEVRLELSVLWSTLFSNRCLHYVKQNNGKKALIYAQDALRYLNQHSKDFYTSNNREYIYNLVTMNSESTLASYYLLEGNIEKAYESIIKAVDIVKDKEFREQLNADVVRVWLLQALKIVLTYFKKYNDAEDDSPHGTTLTPELRQLFSDLNTIALESKMHANVSDTVLSLLHEMIL